jgi:AraC-like DNA-binding protein
MTAVASQPDPLAVDDAVYRLLFGAAASAGPPVRRPARDGANRVRDRIPEIQDWIASDPSRPFRLEELASCAGCTPWHFSRTFAEVAGVSLVRSVTRLRLDAAVERLLAGEGEDLAALALDAGFSSHSHFTAAFRREFGATPAAVRRLRARTSSLRRGRPYPPEPGVLRERARVR